MEQQDLILRVYCAIAVAQREGFTNTREALTEMLMELLDIRDEPVCEVADDKTGEAVAPKSQVVPFSRPVHRFTAS